MDNNKLTTEEPGGVERRHYPGGGVEQGPGAEGGRHDPGGDAWEGPGGEGGQHDQGGDVLEGPGGDGGRLVPGGEEYIQEKASTIQEEPGDAERRHDLGGEVTTGAKYLGSRKKEKVEPRKPPPDAGMVGRMGTGEVQPRECERVPEATCPIQSSPKPRRVTFGSTDWRERKKLLEKRALEDPPDPQHLGPGGSAGSGPRPTSGPGSRGPQRPGGRRLSRVAAAAHSRAMSGWLGGSPV